MTNLSYTIHIYTYHTTYPILYIYKLIIHYTYMIRKHIHIQIHIFGSIVKKIDSR